MILISGTSPVSFLLAVLLVHLTAASPLNSLSPEEANANASVFHHDLLLTGQDGPSSSPLHTNAGGGELRGSLILYNGKIHTMDTANPLTSVIAIKDGTIVYVGDSREEALRVGKFNPASRAINLRGRFTLPGLVDCHNHIVLLGNRPGHHQPLEYAPNITQLRSIYRTKAKTVPKGDFITTIGGFHPNQFTEQRLPTLTELDTATPNHPVFISVGFSGPAVTNSLGKTYFSTVPPADLRPLIFDNGTIASGIENGKALLFLRRQFLTFEARKRGVRDAMTYATSVGLTTHLDQGAFNATNTPNDWAANEDLYTFHNPWLAVYDDFAKGISKFVPSIRLRINFLTQDSTPGVPTLTARLQNSFPFFGNDLIRTGGIGEFATDLSNYASGPVLDAAVDKIAAAGWRYETHSLNDIDAASIISSWEKLAVKYGEKFTMLRWVLAHVPKITPALLQRLKSIGGGVNLSSWLYFAGTGNATNPAGPPFKTVLASGIPAAFGGDGAQIAPLSPWPQIYYAVTGKNAKGELVNPGETISREEALKLYTVKENWFLGGPDEGRVGILEKGRWGDVIVLSDDYFKVRDERLKSLRSVLTVVGGVVVWEEK
ncbi:putative amidohydrolase family protein [Rhypophila sp. PSN 637]